MVTHQLVATFCKDAIALFCAASLTISSPIQEKAALPIKSAKINIAINKNLNDRNANIYLKTQLWRYLRKGINYLEASGREVPLMFQHPGGKAYGPLALTPIAVKDVQEHYPRLKRYGFKEVISKRSLYEKFAILYADMLLKHYIKIDYYKMPREEVFNILQRAWFLGPTLYMKGHSVIASREVKAAEFLSTKS